jgi:soluble lytic murein transglycosylase-like protein
VSDVFVLASSDDALHLSDRQPDARFVLLLRVLEHNSHSAKAAACRMKGVREDDIQAAAAASGLDVALLYAVIEIESACNTRALSRKGAMGLMQLMPATARRYGVTDPRDAAQNIRAGSRHLRYLLTLFADDTALALAAYNAGEGAVNAHGRQIPPYPETQRYVPAVLARYAALQR